MLIQIMGVLILMRLCSVLIGALGYALSSGDSHPIPAIDADESWVELILLSVLLSPLIENFILLGFISLVFFVGDRMSMDKSVRYWTCAIVILFTAIWAHVPHLGIAGSSAGFVFLLMALPVISGFYSGKVRDGLISSLAIHILNNAIIVGFRFGMNI